MSSKSKHDSPQWKWEQALIEAYYDHRWHKLLDPLYEQFVRWKAGDLTHEALNSAIHEVHKQSPELYNLFGSKRSWLISLIQWDAEWFNEYVIDHPPPPGVELKPTLPEP
jgi:hypothetical protein